MIMSALAAPRLVAAGAALMLAAGVLWWIDDRAYRSGEAACEARHAAETRRQIEAARIAEERAAARVGELEATRRALAEQQRRIEHATRDLAGDCLPADVVRSLGAGAGQP